MRDHIQKLINTTIQLQEEKNSIKLQSKINLKNAPKEITIARTISDGSIESASDVGSNVNFSLLPQSNPIFLSETGSPTTFPRLSLGSSAYSFIQMFQNTQMFAEYMEKSRQNRLSLDISSPQATESNENALNHADQKSESDDENESKGLSIQQHSDIDRQTNDPLILLFNMMISGTCPLERNELFKLEEMYLSLYPLDRYACDLFNGDRNPTTLKENTSRQNFQMESIERIISVDNSTKDETPLESELWCNGRCGGLANTDICTNICLQVWEHKMLQLKKQASALEIVKKNRTILLTQPSLHTEG
jgi:hypothetical protein